MTKMIDLNLELEKALKSPYMAYIYGANHLGKVPTERRDEVLHLLQDVVINSGNAYYAYIFARDIPGANKKALEESVIKSGDAECAYLFAMDVEGANINALEEMIIKSGDAECAYWFALDVEGANKKRLESILQQDGTYWNLYKKESKIKI